jgi:hypothetical protein
MGNRNPMIETISSSGPVVQSAGLSRVFCLFVERCDAGSAQPCDPLWAADFHETSAHRVTNDVAGDATKIAIKPSASGVAANMAILIVRKPPRVGGGTGLLFRLMSSSGALVRCGISLLVRCGIALLVSRRIALLVRCGISLLVCCGISLLIGCRVVLLSARERRGGKCDRDCEAQSFQGAHLVLSC